MWSGGVRSASLRGIAGNPPGLNKSGTACGNVNVGSRSGLFSSLRYRVHQLVSTVSCMRLVSRSLPLDPVAVLPGKVRNGSRSTVAFPFEAKHLKGGGVGWISTPSWNFAVWDSSEFVVLHPKVALENFGCGREPEEGG